MLSRGLHDAIVRRLYGAAAGEYDWPHVLSLMADSFGYSAGVFTVFDAATGRMRARAHGRPDEFADNYYRSETFRRDPRAAIHMAVRPGQVYHDRALYDVQAMLRNEHVRDSIEAIGVAHQIGLSIRLPNAVSAAFTLLSTEAEGPATDQAVTAFRRLAPHIEHAAALATIIEQSAATQAALLDALATRADGIILMDVAGRLTFANDGARAILAAGDGLSWSSEGFATARAQETRRLRGAVAAAIACRDDSAEATSDDRVLVTRPSGRRCYFVRVLPAPPVERLLTRLEIACVLHIHDLGAERLPDRRLLTVMFGLSDREVDLAIEMVRCAGLPEAAAAAGMAYNTARNHLQSIFRKCEVKSQAEAVALFAALP
jgi:DNA-binding CsgD family transcriptional regulator/PAS domain-containing protein